MTVTKDDLLLLLQGIPTFQRYTALLSVLLLMFYMGENILVGPTIWCDAALAAIGALNILGILKLFYQLRLQHTKRMQKAWAKDLLFLSSTCLGVMAVAVYRIVAPDALNEDQQKTVWLVLLLVTFIAFCIPLVLTTNMESEMWLDIWDEVERLRSERLKTVKDEEQVTNL